MTSPHNKEVFGALCSIIRKATNEVLAKTKLHLGTSPAEQSQHTCNPALLTL